MKPYYTQSDEQKEFSEIQIGEMFKIKDSIYIKVTSSGVFNINKNDLDSLPAYQKVDHLNVGLFYL